MQMACPANTWKLPIVLPMALAVMLAVPKVEMRLKRMSRPKWNIPFSTPLGMAMRKILRMTRFSKRNARMSERCSSSFSLKSSHTITTAATVRETSVGMATPATSKPRPKIKMALPATLMPFISSETLSDTPERDIVRKSAAPPL